MSQEPGDLGPLALQVHSLQVEALLLVHSTWWNPIVYAQIFTKTQASTAPPPIYWVIVTQYANMWTRG